MLQVGGDGAALAGGLDYPGAEEVSGFSVAAVEMSAHGTGASAEAWRVQTELPGWSLLLDYRFGGEYPEFGWHLSSPAPGPNGPPFVTSKWNWRSLSTPPSGGCTPPGTGWRQGPASLTSAPYSPSPPPPAVSDRWASSA